MTFSAETKLGYALRHPEAREILTGLDPFLSQPSFMLQFRKMGTIGQFLDSLPPSETKAEALTKLAAIPESAPQPQRPRPSSDYEADSVPRGSAAVQAPGEAPRWGVFELELSGPSHGNPFVDAELEAVFALATDGARTFRVPGFYDGDGVYRIRFMPDAEGDWTYRTRSNARSLDGIEGGFRATAPEAGNRGPVRVRDTYHFAYEDGTPYIPVGTTCYVWTHQGEALEEQTLETLARSPFNKIRMCVFPKDYHYNANEPELYPYARAADGGWDFARFDPAYFRHLEKRIGQLGELGIEADLILFHAYDRWGFSEMGAEADDRYVRYVVARLSAFRQMWWSLANEYDLMWSKGTDDWERIGRVATETDPYGHLISIHNCGPFYDYGRPWITHSSIQRQDVYRTAEYTDEWRTRWGKPVVIDECAYEGNAGQGWGNISGEEMTRRFWEGAVRGGYVGHGETYMHPEDVIWWAKGGALHGTSPERIAFLRRILEEGPAEGITPLPKGPMDWDVPIGGTEDGRYRLYYFGFNRPAFREFAMPAGSRYAVDVIDTWNMTVDRLEGEREGRFRIELPGREYMAVRLTRV